MQISDMLGQYNRNVTNGTEELSSAQSTQKLVSTVGDMEIGNVFEGTVSQMKNGRVILALGNGQMLAARIDGKVDMQPGTSMFFQVKANEGGTILIRPYLGAGNVGNPILLNALTAAQIPVTQRNLTMVDVMMKEQLPIDKHSLSEMVKTLNANPTVKVETLIQMIKIGLPVTEEMAAQYESYLSNHHEILGEMEQAVLKFSAVLADESLTTGEAAGLYNKIANLVLGNGQEVSLPTQMQSQETTAVEVPVLETGEQPLTVQMAGEQAASGKNVETVQQQTMQMQDMSLPLLQLLNAEQLENLAKTLQNIPTFVGSPHLFEGIEPEEIFVNTLAGEKITPEDIKLAETLEMKPGSVELQKDMTTGDFLKAVQTIITENSQYGFAGISKLFGSPEFQMILHHAMTKQWLLKPEQVKEPGKLNALYEKMDMQLRQMEHAVRQIGQGETQTTFLQASSEVRGNIEFMNQMNQIYSYVQIPLQMSGQNANGELYVYANKKQKQDADAELTAFLHLDMEHLGMTDVSIKMKDRQVKTNFYLADDASYNLLKKHLPILEKHLQQKGYQCTITISNEQKSVDFKEAILQKEQRSAGVLQRYSFDVRA